jgi:hypothetical protein
MLASAAGRTSSMSGFCDRPITVDLTDVLRA